MATHLVQEGSRPVRRVRRWGSKAGWHWWCRKGAFFGWLYWTWSPDTPGPLGNILCWFSSWLDDVWWPTLHFLSCENIISLGRGVCLKTNQSLRVLYLWKLQGQYPPTQWFHLFLKKLRSGPLRWRCMSEILGWCQWDRKMQITMYYKVNAFFFLSVKS